MCGGNDDDQYYFFTKLKKENMSTQNGFWKEIGVTEPIFSGTDKKVGMKKYLVFNIAEGGETSWVMQEYHISSSVLDNVVSGFIYFVTISYKKIIIFSLDN